MGKSKIPLSKKLSLEMITNDEVSRVASATCSNMDRVLGGMKTLDGGRFPILTDVERQRAYVDSSLDRCRRCGDPVVYLVSVGMASLCNDCEKYLRLIDGGLMWFIDIINRLDNPPDGGAG
jgi:hypothetical protein